MVCFRPHSAIVDHLRCIEGATVVQFKSIYRKYLLIARNISSNCEEKTFFETSSNEGNEKGYFLLTGFFVEKNLALFVTRYMLLIGKQDQVLF